MSTSMLARVRKHFNSDLVPQSTNRHNQRAWIRSIRLLGDRWLLATTIPRAGTAVPPPRLSSTPIPIDIARATQKRSRRTKS
jgi:hypothetical protein